jgi:hypothetical protein
MPQEVCREEQESLIPVSELALLLLNKPALPSRGKQMLIKQVDKDEQEQPTPALTESKPITHREDKSPLSLAA